MSNKWHTVADVRPEVLLGVVVIAVPRVVAILVATALVACAAVRRTEEVVPQRFDLSLNNPSPHWVEQPSPGLILVVPEARLPPARLPLKRNNALGFDPSVETWRYFGAR